jgi:predicted RNase H-like HicB family nuclease
MKYAVIIEQCESGFGAHVPDLPGCIAVGCSRERVLQLIHEAVAMHLEGLRLAGERVPAPSSVEFVEVAA